MSRDVLFDKSKSWYSLLSSTPENSIPIVEDEVGEAKMISEEEEIDTLEESLISFRLSRPNEELDCDGQPIDMLTRGKDSTVQSPQRKGRRRCLRITTLKARRIGVSSMRP